MASLAPSSEQFEYFRIFDLPSSSSLPEGLRGRTLFTKANFVRRIQSNDGSSYLASSSHKSSAQISTTRSRVDGSCGKGSGSGFNYSKALKTLLNGAGTSATSRGDGKFQGGDDFAVSEAPGGRAKFVHLAPDALGPENAERTLQQLDQLQKTAGKSQSGSPGAAAGGPRGGTGAAPAKSLSLQHQNAAALAAAANILYDISDDVSDSGCGTVGSAASCGVEVALPSAGAGASGTHGGEGPTGGLRIPEYTLRELTDGSKGQIRVEVAILLPDVSSPGEVDVWLGAGRELQVAVPGKYQLKMALPYPVLDDTSHAKWSKAKKRLTLTLLKKLE